MNSAELRQKFLDFFKARGHAVVPSSSLIPDDPSVLLTTAGMQQFVPYFMGGADPEQVFKSRRVMSVQKSFRTVDIDYVGDESHLTFFEMLGHFSFGDYFKKETVEWTYEFATQALNISADRMSVTVFEGDDKIPFDKESYDAWKKFLPENKIKKGPREDNIWGPVGAEGICGAANEVYVDGMEVATLVFPEYFCHKDESLTPLAQRGVDVGWGMERVAMVVENKHTVFDTFVFRSIMMKIREFGGRRMVQVLSERIIADHIRASVLLISDGITPSNKEAGYILRRLLRRAIRLADGIEMQSGELLEVARVVQTGYENVYPNVAGEEGINVVKKEERKFREALKQASKELNKLEKIDSNSAFRLFETYGLPYELIKELAGEKAKGLSREEFDSEFKKHQEISRAGLEKKFGGHGLLLDTGELKAVDERELKIVTRLHTATHLMQAALREVLGPEVKQNGSDITAERTRFDFSFLRKVTTEELKSVEDLVNQKILEDLPVSFIEMPFEEAKKTGALYFFKAKYGDKVKVYFIGKDLKSAWSREFCGGPHVNHTAEVGKFKILKEESTAAGTRRIRATVA